MSRELDLEGQRFGRLVAVHKLGSRNGNRVWACLCDCGGETEIRADNLKRTRSCGCLRAYRPRRASGRSRHPLYATWRSMIERCRNPNRPKYRYYGARGIVVCARWLGPDGFVHFLADVGERPDGTTLDRIDNDGGYEPRNVRWATPAQQNANRRNGVPSEA